jgi:hypothetical protein
MKELAVKIDSTVKTREPFYLVCTFFRNLETEETWWSTYRCLNLSETDKRYIKILDKVKGQSVVFNKEPGDYDDGFKDFYTANGLEKEEADFMYEDENIPEDLTGYYSEDCDCLTCDEVEIFYVDINSVIHDVSLIE